VTHGYREAVGVTFALFERSQADELARFLSSETWSFHAGERETAARVRVRINNGAFDSGHDRTYCIQANSGRVGFVHLTDLGNGAPLFDLRLLSGHRGRGLGTITVKWLTEQVFQEFPCLIRIEANTREDNIAMRRVLTKCGFVKEAHHRDAWPADGGAVYDSIGYGILRRDWKLGTTTPVDWDDEP
jgi:RimJ/RimL family protein N-acetyltransferase